MQVYYLKLVNIAVGESQNGGGTAACRRTEVTRGPEGLSSAKANGFHWTGHRKSQGSRSGRVPAAGAWSRLPHGRASTLPAEKVMP